jgi:hypothetical protein
MNARLPKSKTKAGLPGRQKSTRGVAHSNAQRAQKVLPSQPNSPSVTVLEFPPPDYLLEMARGEPSQKLLQEYAESIRTLRDEKGFTFREIAEWLTEHGVEADHNAVYRVYTKEMSEDQVAALEREEA